MVITKPQTDIISNGEMKRHFNIKANYNVLRNKTCSDKTLILFS